MNAILSTPKVRRLFALSILARLPLTMLSIGLLVHAQRLTGSFAAAGAVDGAYALALGFSGPWLGQFVDRRGQTAVLLVSSAVSAALLIGVAVLPAGTPVAALVVVAAAIGASAPPLAACVRTLFPRLISDADALRAAYAVDASAVELTWISGPPLALVLGSIWSTGGALMVVGILLVLATSAFAAQPVSRSWRSKSTASRQRGGALRAPAMRTLVMALLGVGAVFGAAEVGVTAAATSLGASVAAGPLLGLWGAGSLVGGVLTARLGGGARTAAGLSLMLLALALGHLALALAAGSVLALGFVIFLAGAWIAPTYASIYSMVEGAAPQGTVTEAFSWLTTAVAMGGCAGSALAGALADGVGPAAAFALAGGAGAFAVLAITLRGGTLPRPAVQVA